eukprot:5469568-Amphidinium_carterae.1
MGCTLYNMYVKPSAGLSSEQNLGATFIEAASRKRGQLESAPPSWQRTKIQGPLAPESDMLVEGEEGLDEGTVAKVLRGPEQPTAAEVEQHEAQGHLLAFQTVVSAVREWTGCWPTTAASGSLRGGAASRSRRLRFLQFSAGEHDDGERIAMVVLYDSRTRSTGAIALPGN